LVNLDLPFINWFLVIPINLIKCSLEDIHATQKSKVAPISPYFLPLWNLSELTEEGVSSVSIFSPRPQGIFQIPNALKEIICAAACNLKHLDLTDLTEDGVSSVSLCSPRPQRILQILNALEEFICAAACNLKHQDLADLSSQPVWDKSPTQFPWLEESSRLFAGFQSSSLSISNSKNS